jgi:chemotaxis receptor (MCP) glutamine deamidase CheD
MIVPPQPINLRPGQFHAARAPEVIRTVLGSCVAVCLYDEPAGVGGMNHFMLPDRGHGDDQMPARYGTHAMELLINKIMGMGGQRCNLRAKAFGGADVLAMPRSGLTVGAGNTRFAIGFLEREGIRLVSSRLGGTDPLEVVFYAGSARTLVRAVGRRAMERVKSSDKKQLALLASLPQEPSSDDVTLF